MTETNKAYKPKTTKIGDFISMCSNVKILFKLLIMCKILQVKSQTTELWVRFRKIILCRAEVN